MRQLARFARLARLARPAAAIALAIGAGLLPSGSAGAQPQDRDAGRAEHFIAEHADELELDEATRAQIEEIVQRTQREARKLRHAHHQAGRTLRELLELDAPDESAVMNQADVVGRLESQRLKQRIGAMLEIRALLSREQRERLVELRRAEGGERPDRRQRRERMRACEPDVLRLCPDADHPRAVFRCLEQEREALSSECGEAFDSLQADLNERRNRRGPDRRRPWWDDGP